ncbi:MAG TPA: hypothetical protein PKI32_07135 [Opitutales bacterium]|nr:hypothetical protein [Opitutales bacterium]
MNEGVSSPRVGDAPEAKTRLVEILLLILGIVVTYIFIFELPYFISEYAEFYSYNNNLDLQGWLQNYNPLRGGWYRPSAFILQYQVVAGLVGWHNIFAFKCVAVISMLLLGHGVYFLSRYITGDGLVAVLAGLAAAIHPVMYMLSVDLFYFDAMYQIVLVWALYWFLKSLEGRPVQRLCIVSVLFLFALTCKEQAFVFPAMMCAVLFIGFLFADKKRSFLGERRPQIVVSAALMLLASLFAIGRAAAMGSTGGEYRSTLDWAQLIPNALAGGTWIFRLFPWSTPSWDGIPAEMWATPNAALFHRLCSDLFSSHEMWHPTSAVMGFFILTVFLAGSWRIFRKGSGRDRFLLCSLWSGIAIFSLFPVYSGGRPWHFAIPAIFVMIVFAWGLGVILRRLPGRWVTTAIVVVCSAMMLLSMEDFRLSRAKRLAMNYINYDALTRPPLPANDVPKGARIFYATGGGCWAYGNGHLFEWVYLRPDVKDMPLKSLADLSLNDLSAIADGRDLVFSYDPVGRNWKNISEEAGARYRASEGDFLAVDFGSTGNAQLYLGKGWSGQEKSGIWTEGTEAEILLPPLSARDFLLRLWIHGYTPASHSGQRMEILVNSVHVAGVERIRGVDESALVVVPIPASLIRSGGQTLLLRIADPARPCDVDQSTDARLLGFFFERIEIIPADSGK